MERVKMVLQTSTMTMKYGSDLREHRQYSDPALQRANEEAKQPATLIKKKCVRFDRCRVFQRSKNFKNVDTSTLWYQHADYQSFKAAYQQDAKNLVRENKRNRYKTITKVFAHCTAGEKPTKELTTELENHLLDVSRIGIERIASKECFHDKKKRRSMINETVMAIQKHEFENRENRACVLRMACEELSYPSVLLAHIVAKAAAM